MLLWRDWHSLSEKCLLLYDLNQMRKINKWINWIMLFYKIWTNRPWKAATRQPYILWLLQKKRPFLRAPFAYAPVSAKHFTNGDWFKFYLRKRSPMNTRWLFIRWHKYCCSCCAGTASLPPGLYLNVVFLYVCQFLTM